MPFTKGFTKAAIYSISGEMTITNPAAFRLSLNLPERPPMTIPASLAANQWVWAIDEGLSSYVSDASRRLITWDQIYEDLESQRKNVDLDPNNASAEEINAAQPDPNHWSSWASSPRGDVYVAAPGERLPRADEVWQLKPNPEVQVTILASESGQVAYRHPAGLVLTNLRTFMKTYALKRIVLAGHVDRTSWVGRESQLGIMLDNHDPDGVQKLHGKRVEVTVIDE